MQHIWFFAFDRALLPTEAQQLAAALHQQLGQWKAHGTPVQSQVSFRYGHFLFIEALSDVSGCSIDWLFTAVENIAAALDVQLVDNSQVFYWDGQGEDAAVARMDFRQVPDALASGQLTADTLVFDNAAIQQGEFERWEAPLHATWLRRYLPQVA